MPHSWQPFGMGTLFFPPKQRPKENSGKAFRGTHYTQGNHQGYTHASGDYFYSYILNTVSFQTEFMKGQPGCLLTGKVTEMYPSRKYLYQFLPWKK